MWAEIKKQWKEHTALTIVLAAYGLLSIVGTAVWAWAASGGLSTALGAVPQGMIMAYTSKAEAHEFQKHCPSGWEPFEQARGRFLIGAGNPTHPDHREWKPVGSESGVQLSDYNPFASGGEEDHVLEEPEMPSHGHGVGSLVIAKSGGHYHTKGNIVHDSGGAAYFVRDGGSNRYGPYSTERGPGEHQHPITGESASIGNGEAHNNMPPYIALYFCKKL